MSVLMVMYYRAMSMIMRMYITLIYFLITKCIL